MNKRALLGNKAESSSKAMENLDIHLKKLKVADFLCVCLSLFYPKIKVLVK